MSRSSRFSRMCRVLRLMLNRLLRRYVLLFDYCFGRVCQIGLLWEFRSRLRCWVMWMVLWCVLMFSPWRTDPRRRPMAPIETFSLLVTLSPECSAGRQVSMDNLCLASGLALLVGLGVVMRLLVAVSVCLMNVWRAFWMLRRCSSTACSCVFGCVNGCSMFLGVLVLSVWDNVLEVSELRCRVLLVR